MPFVVMAHVRHPRMLTLRTRSMVPLHSKAELNEADSPDGSWIQGRSAGKVPTILCDLIVALLVKIYI